MVTRHSKGEKMRRYVIIICLALSFILLTGVAAFPLQETRIATIKAVYQNVKVLVNGRQLDLPVAPFQVEGGHLMVPARALGEALGCRVEWDPNSNIVYINNDSLLRTENKSAVPFVYVEDLPVLRNVGPFFQLKSRPITIASRQFGHGLVVELVAPPSGEKEEDKPAHFAEAVVELGGKYTWLEGFLGVDDETRNSRGSFTLQVYGDDLLLYQSEKIKPSQYPQKFIVNVSRFHRLTFVVRWENAGRGDYDRLWVALADLLVY